MAWVSYMMINANYPYIFSIPLSVRFLSPFMEKLSSTVPIPYIPPIPLQ